jgi:hypothetical protein
MGPSATAALLTALLVIARPSGRSAAADRGWAQWAGSD